VLRSFYDFHRDCGTGPVLNPFPLDSSRRGRRHAHHNPMDEWAPEKAGRYRPVVPRRIPRAIPDERFNELFASLPSDRDRALVAFWVSTGARASELLGMRQCDFKPGEQLVIVTAVKHMARRRPGESPATAPERHRRNSQLREQFPPRPARWWWPETVQGQEETLRRLTSPPFTSQGNSARAARRRGTAKVLRWLASFPGD